MKETIQSLIEFSDESYDLLIKIATEKEVKEEVVSSLDDYLISIKYRLSLCHQIKELLATKNL